MQNNRRKPSPNESSMLLAEVESLCPLCAKNLMYTKAGRKEKSFEAAHIYPLNPTPEEILLLQHEDRLHEDVNHIDNLIALCKDCHERFDKPRTVEEYRKLFAIKKVLINRSKTRAKFHEYQVEMEITHILTILLNGTSEITFASLSLDVLKLDEKADETLTGLTKRRIRNDITDYYLYVQEQFKQLDKQYPKTFETIASQIKTFYLKVSRTEKSQEDIYELLTEWLSKKTENTSLNACGIITSFFIQNCEVF